LFRFFFFFFVLGPSRISSSSTQTLGCQPIASVEGIHSSKLGEAQLVEEVTNSGGGKFIKVTGVKHPGKTVSVVLHGTNQLVLDEADRSLHDALCVIRSLVKKR
jgi:T-complex protein 1 subunit delta